jgi:hypothetical protein
VVSMKPCQAASHAFLLRAAPQTQLQQYKDASSKQQWRRQPMNHMLHALSCLDHNRDCADGSKLVTTLSPLCLLSLLAVASAPC